MRQCSAHGPQRRVALQFVGQQAGAPAGKDEEAVHLWDRILAQETFHHCGGQEIKVVVGAGHSPTSERAVVSVYPLEEYIPAVRPGLPVTGQRSRGRGGVKSGNLPGADSSTHPSRLRRKPARLGSDPAKESADRGMQCSRLSPDPGMHRRDFFPGNGRQQFPPGQAGVRPLHPIPPAPTGRFRGCDSRNDG